MAVYVDTSAWIALYEPKDQNHTSAVSVLKRLTNADELLVTGWHTVVEFADGLARHYEARRAAAEVDRLLASPRLRVQDSEIHRRDALEVFRRRPEWGVDLSDCLSFALMRSHGVQQAFSYDRDFEKPGFVRLA